MASAKAVSDFKPFATKTNMGAVMMQAGIFSSSTAKPDTPASTVKPKLPRKKKENASHRQSFGKEIKGSLPV